MRWGILRGTDAGAGTVPRRRTTRATCEQVLEESGQQEQLIEALLTLAQGQRGIDRAETFDLASVVGEVLDSREGASAARRVEIGRALTPATISGDARLVERLVSNLVDNAIRHNVPGGRVDVAVQFTDRATLTVTNTGPVVPPEEVDRLLQPFQRLSADRTSHRDGLGLGLSIVTAVARSHDAVLGVRARPDGGLEIDVHFPARAMSPSAESAPVPLSCRVGPPSASAEPAITPAAAGRQESRLCVAGRMNGKHAR